MTSEVDRRRFLKYTGVAGAATGALWVAPSVLGSSSAFAAGSQNVVASKNFWKYVNSQSTYSRATACAPGYLQSEQNGAANRGTVTYNYTASTGQICISVELSSGPSIGERIVYLLLKDASGQCVGQLNLGTWGSGSSFGPACYTLNAGDGTLSATSMAITAEESGGGGTAIYLTDHVAI